MPEFQENIVTEDFQEDPKPGLRNRDRKKLDSIILQMRKNREPDKNIQLVVDDFKKKYSVLQPDLPSAVPQVDLSKLPKYAETEDVFAKEARQTAGVIVTPKERHLAEKVKKGQQTLLSELQSNPDVAERVIKRRRAEEFARNVPVPISDQPQTASDAAVARLIPQEKPQDLPVTPEEVQQELQSAQTNEFHARSFIKEIEKYKPEKAAQLQQSFYDIDVSRNLLDDPNAQQRLPKVLKNSTEIAKGKLVYDPVNGKVLKPEGLIKSFMTGRKYMNEAYEDYDFFRRTENPDAIASELDNRRAQYDPDEPLPVPKGKLGQLGEIAGGTPPQAIIGGVIAGLAGPEASVVAGAAINAVESAKLEYANNFKRVYYELRDQGMNSSQAIQEARKQAEAAAATGAVVGGVTGAIGARWGAKPFPKSAITSGFRQAAASVLRKEGRDFSKTLLEGLAAGGIAAGGEVYKNELAQDIGINRDITEGVAEQIEGNLLFAAAMGAAVRLGRGMNPKNYRTLLNGLKKVDDGKIDAFLQKGIAEDNITQEQADAAKSEIDNYKKTDAQIPENVSEAARIQIQDKIKKRNDLEQRLETLDKAFHPEIKEKIKGIEEEINTLSKERAPKPDKEQSELKKLVDQEIEEGNVHGFTVDILKEADISDLPGFMKEIADQVHDPNSAETTIRTFGEVIVNKAKEMFPLKSEKPRITVSTPIIRNVKLKENAIPESSPSSILQHPQEGIGETGSERAGMESGEQGQKTSEESQTTGEEKVGAIPPEMFDLPFEAHPKDVTRLAHSDTEKIYEQIGRPERIPRATKKDIELENEADELIKSGYDFHEKADKILNNEEHSFTETEQVAFAKMVGALKAKLEKTPINLPEFEELQSTIEKFSRASDIVGTKEGAAFRARRMFVLNDDSLSSMLTRKKEANADQPLSTEQTEEVKVQREKIKSREKSFKDKGKELADRIRALRPKTDKAQSNIFGLPIAIYDTALVTIANAVEGGANLADAIQQGLKYIKDNGGFKSRREEADFVAHLKGQETQEQRLRGYKSRTRKNIEELKRKTEEGEFEKGQKSILELDEEALALKDEYREAKAEFELALQRDKLKNRPIRQKFVDALLEPIRAVRTIKASMDFSAPLRQGFIPTIAHPQTATKAAAEMFQQAFSKRRFDRWLADLKESPEYQTMENSDLYIADPTNLHLSAKEEQFMSNLAEKIPVIGKLIKGSERAYVAYLNKMRADIFRQGVEAFEADGKTFQNSPALYKGLATYINNATGRGGLGALEPAAQTLNTVFFSPRLMASRLNILGLTDIGTGGNGFYAKLPKEVRVMALKDIGKTIGFGLTILGLSKLAGAETESDPRSSDFGKIKVGNTRWDIWGGFQPYVRLMSQLFSGQTKSTHTGQINELGSDKFKQRSRGELLETFFRGKLAPVPSSIVDLLYGKDVVGEEATIVSELKESFIPMIYSDVEEAMKDQGLKALFTVGLPSTFGVSSQTYETKAPASKGRKSQRRDKPNKRTSKID